MLGVLKAEQSGGVKVRLKVTRTPARHLMEGSGEAVNIPMEKL